MPPIIRPQGSLSIEAVDVLYEQLERNPDAPLLLPTKLTSRFFGLDAAIIQFILTWARTSTQPRLLTYANTEAEGTSQLANLTEKDHGLIALLLAHAVLTHDGKTAVSKPEGNIQCRLNTPEGGNVDNRGGKFLLLCHDENVRVSNATPLYYPTNDADHGFLQEKEFRQLLEKLITKSIEIVRSQGIKTPMISRSIGDLSTIIFELFENTHLWARKDAANEVFPWGIRGIRCEVHNDYRQRFQQDTVDSPTVAAYIESLPIRSERLHLVEISIFDSGPGLAARPLRRPINAGDTIAAEYAAVVDRLAAHHSSSDATHRGKGLSEVMQLLSQHHGFLRVRTGRLNLQRDFIRYTYDRPSDAGASAPVEPYLLDRNGTSNIAQYGNAVGVLISLFFPLAVDQH